MIVGFDDELLEAGRTVHHQEVPASLSRIHEPRHLRLEFGGDCVVMARRLPNGASIAPLLQGPRGFRADVRVTA